MTDPAPLAAAPSAPDWLIRLAEELGVAPGPDATFEAVIAALQFAAAFAWQSGVRQLAPQELLSMHPVARDVWHAAVCTAEQAAALERAICAVDPTSAGLAAIRALSGPEAAVGTAMEVNARRERMLAGLVEKLTAAAGGAARG